ncbi:MAG: polysaccharide biosynthesis protein [Mesorhizobium sp.]|uniref:polysaccharide biosynthesis protein n=1 Tax=Mesorhizobium sp. TaxID=1871066 RepID=UPI0011F5587E|nr:nucleoside-diphosphate sugar epimerase/dehydratase [Mesorhizobium sp.]TIM49047.1 MAG: polysaccharide biosynthesis protein [Mesorhizobium sp.]
MISSLETMLNRPHAWANGLTRSQKKLILASVDALLVAFSLWTSVAIRLGSLWPQFVWNTGWWLLLALPLVGIGIFYSLGLYRVVMRSMGRHGALCILQGTIFLSLVLTSFGYFDTRLFIPRSTPIIFALVLGCSLIAVRMIGRSYYRWLNERGAERRPVLIYGAGQSGLQLVSALDAAKEFRPVAFLDDEPSLAGSFFAGRRVHPPADLDALLARFGVSDVLLALPSISRARRKEIVEFLSQRPVQVQTIPSMAELVSGIESIDKLRNVGVEELLGRDAVDPDLDLFTSVRGRTVMVTGAGGSIGSELCRQIVTANPRCLVLYEMSEFGLYSIEQELSQLAPRGFYVHAVLGSVRDEPRLEQTIRRHGVETIFHAAAYKHVPLVEANPFEGIRNNTFGTECVARVAARCGVGRAILVSTDKAVRPTNVMGASKRLAERVFQKAQQRCRTTVFSMVRFGNVMGSSGSVIPLFQKQIAAGGPVTVTHPEVIRYFMTIPEAAQLVIQAGSMAHGGDVFLLDMGSPVSILDLAKRMIHLSGLDVKDDVNPYGDIEIVFSGLRPGEKLFEELLVDGTALPTAHPKIMRSLDSLAHSGGEIDDALSELRSAVENADMDATIGLLHRLVEGYSTEMSGSGPEMELASTVRGGANLV